MNPYLVQYLDIEEQRQRAEKAVNYEQPFDTLINDPALREKWNTNLSAYERRRELVHKYAFPIPTDEAIAKLVSCSPLVEIGAGTGYWASLVQQAGGDIIPIDKFPPGYKENQWYSKSRPFTKIEIGDENSLRDFYNRTLFISWPPYDTDMAYNALRKYIGNTFIYIGEGRWGCTANDKFFDLLEERWEEVEVIHIPQWDGIHDYMAIYRRKK